MYYFFEDRFKKKQTKQKQAELSPPDNVYYPPKMSFMAPHEDPKSRPEIGYKKLPKAKPKSPTVETRNPTDFIGKVPINKIFNLPGFNVLKNVLTPSTLAEPWLDEITPQKAAERQSKYIREVNPGLDDLIVQPEPIKEYEFELPTEPVADPQFIRPQVPIVRWNDTPPTGPFITTSPKIGTITYRPPRYHVPPPYLVEVPQVHPIFSEPTPLEIPQLLKGFDVETKPKIDTSYRMPPIGKTNLISDRVMVIDVSTDVKMDPIVRFRESKVKASTLRKREKKASSKYIKMAQMAISLTYGTYTEIMDFVEILVWDAYIYNPKTKTMMYAMHHADGDILVVLDGIATGKYSVDIASTLVDYTISQAQDIIIGKISRSITSEVIDSGNWHSPQGPQGFVNKMQKDYKNVLSQYEGQTTPLLPNIFPREELSQRRLWNAKSGLSPSVRS